jgi:hypothetical protein
MKAKQQRRVIDATHPPTRANYDSASPRGKGFLEYTYSSWPNSEIPKGCPFAKGTPEHEQFQRGQDAAVLAAQDSEE